MQVRIAGYPLLQPHLSVSCLLDKWDEGLTKQDYETKVEDVVDRLNPVLEVLKACF